MGNVIGTLEIYTFIERCKGSEIGGKAEEFWN